MKKFLFIILLSVITTSTIAQNVPSADRLRQDRFFDIVRPNQKTIVGYLNTDLQISLQMRSLPCVEGDNGVMMPSETDFIFETTESWTPSESALIICDMWDRHWCDKSNARLEELAVTLNRVVIEARRKGVKIVHAPSDCMDFYKDYPQRQEAKKYWNTELAALTNGDKLPSEEDAVLPSISPSDEGCECYDCKPHRTWIKQHDSLSIAANDLISASGAELGAYFKETGIKNVILTGVTTNMSIVERSFGVRAMKRMGMNVVLMRDMTYLMYNHPPKASFVDRCSGRDPMMEYIEIYVCPTTVSSDFTATEPFRFTDE
jgi:nicotinamidase-related amidase